MEFQIWQNIKQNLSIRCVGIQWRAKEREEVKTNKNEETLQQFDE